MSSNFCCVIGRPPWQRALRGRRDDMVGKDNFAKKKLSVGGLRLSSGNGVCVLRTGVLIHNSLVLTSHQNLWSKECAENGEFVLTDSNYSDPPPSERSHRVLTRKLLPARCFLANPSLGVTIVGCEPVSFEVPLDMEIAKVPGEIMSLGHRIYVLGHTQHDVKRKALIKFGVGRISSENEQAIEFYSLDGKVWAPGSAGFDEQGKFAFVVGDSKSPSGAKWSMSSLQKIILFEKNSGPIQPGILVHFVREWLRTVWDWGFAELIKERPCLVSSALPGNATKKMSKDPILPIDGEPNTLQELRSVYEGLKGEIAHVHMQSSPREDLIGRKDCAAVASSVASLASPMGTCTPSETSAHVDYNRFSSNLGGIADLAATKKLVQPNCALKEELPTAIDGNNCSITHNGFMTRVVKVRYFNKDILSPDQMPMTDNPNQDPNGSSWFDWGKKTPKSRPFSPKLAAKVASGYPVALRLQFLNDAERTIPERKATDLIKKWETSRAARLQPICCPLPPKDSAKAACGDPLGVRPEFLENDKRIIPECKAPDPNKNRETSTDSNRETSTDSGPQPLRPEFFTFIPERDTSKWTVLRVNARSGDSHPVSDPLSSPKLSSPVSHFKRSFKSTLDQVDSPREFVFGQIHRSTVSPRSRNRVKAVPWKPTGSHGSGDLGYPPVGFPQQGTPRLFRVLRKRIYDLTESTEARAVRKREIQQPGKPRWRAHSRVQKKDDNKKTAALPPRIVKPGEFPAQLFSSQLPCPAQLWKVATARSRKGKKEDITEAQKSQADTTPNICDSGSPHSTRDICTTTAGCSRMPTNRLISKHKEKDRPKLRAKRFLVSSTSWVPNFSAVKYKKYEQQSISKRKGKGKAASSKHVQKGLEPLPSQTNSESDEQQQISCSKHAPKATVVSSASGSPKVPAECKERISTRTKIRPIGCDEEILNEIDRVQAVLRSPRDKSITRECQGRSPRPAQAEGDARGDVDSGMICSGLVGITEPKSEQDTRFTCCQYWKRIITGRRDTLPESMKALFWPQPSAAASVEQHLLRGKPNPPASAEQHTLNVRPNLAARAKHRIPEVQANAAGCTPKTQNAAAREEQREEQQTQKVELNAAAAHAEERTTKVQPSVTPRAKQQTPKGSCTPAREGIVEKNRSLWRKASSQQNINKEFVFMSPNQSPKRHNEAKLWDGTCYDNVWNEPLKIQAQGKQSNQITKPNSQTAGQQQSKVVTGESGIRKLKGAKVYELSSEFAPKMQSVESDRLPTMRDTERAAWDSTCWCDVWHDRLKSQRDGKKTRQTSKPDSRIIAGQRQSKLVNGEGGSSFGICPVYFPVSPSSATSSRLDGDMTSSLRKYPSKSIAVPETGQPAMSSGKKRPQSPVTRLDGRPDTNRVIRECSGKKMISSIDVRLEALIFDTENEYFAAISKRSGVPELAVAKQKLHNWLHKCRAHPEAVPYYQEKSGVPELAFAEPKLQKSLAHPDKAAYNPEKLLFRIGSKTNAPLLARIPESRARLGTATNHSSGGKRHRLGNTTFSAEIEPGVVSSEDGLCISEIGPIVRYEGLQAD